MFHFENGKTKCSHFYVIIRGWRTFFKTLRRFDTFVQCSSPSSSELGGSKVWLRLELSAPTTENPFPVLELQMKHLHKGVCIHRQLQWIVLILEEKMNVCVIYAHKLLQYFKINSTEDSHKKGPFATP